VADLQTEQAKAGAGKPIMMTISAVIPAYNSADFIADAIDSILKQTHPVTEIIVVDDGSVDNTEQVVQCFPDHVRYYKQVNQGPSAARNQGIKMADGEWIAFLDADDQWTPDKIEKQLATLAQYPELQLIAGDMAEIDDQNEPLTPSVLAKHLLLQGFQALHGQPVPKALAALINKNFIPTGTVLVRRDVVLAAGLFNESIRFGEDLELWAKIAARHAITCLPEILMLRRLHGNNATQLTGRMLADLVKVMQSLRYAIPAELKHQGLSPDRLVANSYVDLGYWYFSVNDYGKARAALRSSLRAAINRRAALYLLSACLPPGLVAGIKSIKQALTHH
jgi:glycosyltransferase involved in cell wall biosynthesis